MNPAIKIFAIIALTTLLVSSIEGAAINHQINHQSHNFGKDCICTREFDPYCGSDGVTYSNECLFNCEKRKHPELQLHHYGDCEEDLEISPYNYDQDVCICTLEYNPICSNNDETYSNECLFNCDRRKDSNLKIKSRGACIEDVAVELFEDNCACTIEYNPVCGSDGETYPNKCSLECRQKKREGLKIAYEGECKELSKKVDGCKCSREYLPICGTDDQTYDNECQLHCQRSKTPDLGIQFEGRCDKGEELVISTNDEDDCVCTRIFDPICGSDGKTYSNNCLFNCEQNKHNNLKIAHQGECKAVEAKPDCICTREYTPVCGSNGKTYSNECELNCEQKLDETLELESQGPCDFAIPY